MKQAMGRGLDSLIPRNISPQNAKTGGIIIADLTDIVPNDNQPRRVFDNDLLEELAESIKEKGVIQPIIVTKTPDSDKYMIIEGERRWRASGLAGKKTIPAVIRNAETPKERLELALIANAQREDLGAIELARAYARLINEYGYRQEDVSAVMGRSRSAVANRVRLLSLPDKIINAIEDNIITEGHGKALLGLSNKGRIFELYDKIISKNLSVRETEYAVARANKGSDEKKEEKRLPYIDDIRNELESFFSFRVNIKNRKKGGTIEIKYNSDDELDTIIKKIRGETC